jgi:hypothetical protein
MINERTEQVRAFCIEKFGSVEQTAPSKSTNRIIPQSPSGCYADLGPRTRAWLESTGPAGGKPSASEADMAAACALLATAHTDAEALALLIDSPRGRDALARKGRGGLTYLQRTVGNAARFVGPTVIRSTGQRVRQVTPRRRAARTGEVVRYA